MNIEPLEPRIAPASVLTFTDVDGDLVKITSSLGDLNAAGVATKVPGAITGEQLTLLDLRDASFQGATITTAVTQAGNGDGLVHIGRIDATGRDLASVTIKGDLAVIDVGDANTAATSPALKLLSVRSMGIFGLRTQDGAGDLVSDVNGALGALKVTGDIRNAFVHVVGGADGTIGSVTVGGSLAGSIASGGSIVAGGDIGAVKIGGNVEGGAGAGSGLIQSDSGDIKSVTIGGSLFGGDADFSGCIRALGDLGPVKIGHDVVGGAAINSARILAGDTAVQASFSKLASLTIGGSLIGGEGGFSSGRIVSSGDMGAVKIAGEVRGGGVFAFKGKLAGATIGGSLIGVPASGAGEIFSRGDMGFVKIGGDIVGSTFAGSGSVLSSQGKLAGVTVGGSIYGGSQSDTGKIESGGNLGLVRIAGNLVSGGASGAGSVESFANIAGVTIGGSMLGVNANFAATVSCVGDLAAVKVAHDVGSPATGGVIESTAGKVGGVTIGGSLFGRVTSQGNLGLVKIARDVRGALFGNPGRISSDASIAGVTIGGSLIGGDDGNIFHADTGEIRAISGSIGFVKIGGDLRGGAGQNSGLITCHESVSSISIGGSLVGGNGYQTGDISIGGDLGSLKIGGDLRGGSISGSASLSYSGFISVGIINGAGGRLGSLFIGGSIVAGTDNSSGTFTRCTSIQVADDIGSLTVKGSILGNAVAGDVLVDITAAGQTPQSATKDVAFGKISIGGRVEFTRILAGFGPSATGVQGLNGNASIGAVSVGGDWIASSISAGVNPGSLGFGGGGDAVINNPPGAATDAVIAKIASVTIKGAVVGAPSPFFQSGFVAQQIGSFKAAGFTAPLTAATDAPILIAPYTVNVTILEV